MLIIRSNDTEEVEKNREKNNSCFKIINSVRYLGSFIGEKELETKWVEENIRN